eukprot:5885750-Alexandrium_andersonii.AAC.1
MITARFGQAIAVLEQLTAMRAPLDVTIKALRGKALPKALYGAATCHVPKKARQQLCSVMASAMLGRRDNLCAPEINVSFCCP